MPIMPDPLYKPECWRDFVDPLRTMEATRQIVKNPEQVRNARGDQGETVLHWAALSNLGLITDLLGIGLDVNAQDRQGRTPLDWQNSRVWHICVQRETHMSEGGRYQVRQHSEALIQALWRMGGRAGPKSALDPIQIWTRAGLWSLVDMRQDLEGSGLPLRVLQGLGPQQETALHGWVLASDSPEKHRHLDLWLKQGLSIDAADAQGWTPLRYAIEGLREQPSWHRILLASIRALIQKGASPDVADREGVTPRDRMEAIHAASGWSADLESQLRQALIHDGD